MILSLSLPKISEHLLGATIHRILAQPGAELRPGSPVCEVRADLGAAGQQDCPPVLYFRVVATERAHLSRMVVAVGDAIGPNALLGVATTAAGESADGAPARALRTMSVGIQVDPLAD
jgi:hypothetical protein